MTMTMTKVEGTVVLATGYKTLIKKKTVSFATQLENVDI